MCRRDLDKLAFTLPILLFISAHIFHLFVSKTVTYFANRILILSATYVAQNSAGKNFQGLVQK